MLFSGTIRNNLDPFGLYSDDALHTALSTALYIPRADRGTSILDDRVAENGSNFSLGQVKRYSAHSSAGASMCSSTLTSLQLHHVMVFIVEAATVHRSGSSVQGEDHRHG